MSSFTSRIRNFVATNRGLGYVSIGNIAGNVIGSVFWIILAAFATTETYGKAGYFTTVASFAATVVLFGLPIFLTSFLAKGLAEARHEVASLTLMVSIAAAIGAFVIFHYIPLSILILGVCFFSVSMSELAGQGRYREYAIYNIGQKSANIALSLMLYFIMGFDGIMLGYAISYLAFSHGLVLHFRRARLVFSFPVLSAKKRFLAHSWGLDLSKAIGYSSDKFLIAPLFGYATLGIYQLGIQFLLMQSAIPNVIFTYILREESLGISRRHVKIFGLAITTGISGFVTVVAPYAIPVFFPKFTAAITMIQIAIWGGPMMTLNSIIQSELLTKEKSRPVVISGILFFAVMYALMYYLGNVLGSIGLVYALVLAFLSESVFLIIARSASKKI
jgi:O-antigen/teichoic acid export membrane protein